MVGQVVHHTNPGVTVHKVGLWCFPTLSSVTDLPLKAQRVTMETSQKSCTYICFTGLPSAPLPCLPTLCPVSPLPSAMLQDSTSFVPTCPRPPRPPSWA